MAQSARRASDESDWKYEMSGEEKKSDDYSTS